MAKKTDRSRQHDFRADQYDESRSGSWFFSHLTDLSLASGGNQQQPNASNPHQHRGGCTHRDCHFNWRSELQRIYSDEQLLQHYQQGSCTHRDCHFNWRSELQRIYSDEQLLQHSASNKLHNQHDVQPVGGRILPTQPGVRSPWRRGCGRTKHRFGPAIGFVGIGDRDGGRNRKIHAFHWRSRISWASLHNMHWCSDGSDVHRDAFEFECECYEPIVHCCLGNDTRAHERGTRASLAKYVDARCWGTRIRVAIHSQEKALREIFECFAISNDADPFCVRWRRLRICPASTRRGDAIRNLSADGNRDFNGGSPAKHKADAYRAVAMMK